MAEYKPSISAWVSDNTALTCEVEGCSNHRIWTTRHCVKHGKYQVMFGVPHTIPFRFKMIKPEVEEVTQLFSKNWDHPGLTIYREYFESLITVAGRGNRAIPGHQLFKMAHQLNGDVTKMLVDTSALVLYHERDKEKFHRDIPTDTALFTLLGRAVRSSCKNWSIYRPRITRFAIKSAGKAIWDHFAVFLLQTAKAVEQVQEAKDKYKEALQAPFQLI